MFASQSINIVKDRLERSKSGKVRLEKSIAAEISIETRIVYSYV